MFESYLLTSLQEKVDSRVIRERVLIFLTFFALIFMLWNFTIQSSIDKKTQETKTELDTLVAQRAALQTQITAATQSLANDPDKQKKEQIAQLQTDIQDLETRLQNASQNLIKAEYLPQALQDVLQETKSLSLLEVKTLPVRELQFVDIAQKKQPEPQSPAPISVDESNVGVYQHAVELRVSGNYNQMLQLLIELEKLPWRFYWQSLDYSVEKYPNAEAKLRVYTLSSEEGLFGV